MKQNGDVHRMVALALGRSIHSKASFLQRWSFIAPCIFTVLQFKFRLIHEILLFPVK